MINLKELQEYCEHLPFGNSAFQIIHFVNESKDHPGRASRKIALQIRSKITALKEAEYVRENIKLDIDELNAKRPLTRIGKKRKSLEIDKKMFDLEDQEKVIKDALFELKLYEKMIKDLPKISSRKEFEDQEMSYWKDRLQKDACREIQYNGSVEKGTLMSLEQIGLKNYQKINGQIAWQYGEDKLSLEYENGEKED